MNKNIYKSLIILSIFFISGCTPTPTPTPEPEEEDTVETFEAKLDTLGRIASWEKVAEPRKFQRAYSIEFVQYIDHNDHSKGTFNQQIEFGFNSMKQVNVLVTEGYYLMTGEWSSSAYENEIAHLLRSNYLAVEHRYSGTSLPVSIDYNDNSTWDYLTTEQAASDLHDIVTEFKKILPGKWISTGGSKSGMTTEMFCYYYPGDIDLYLPYVAPFCNSFSDKRMMKFVYEEAGDLQYGEEKAAEIRQLVLDFQVKLLEYRDVLAPKYYQDAIKAGATFSSYVTQDILYDAGVLDFAVGFWQYYQTYSRIETALELDDSNPYKAETCYQYFVGICAGEDFGVNSAFQPYYVQAYQELGNYGYDFSYLREACKDNEKAYVTVSESEEDECSKKINLNDAMLELPQKELMYTKINNMLATTDQQFVIIYGSSDPWYSVRPNDVTGRDNISIYVNDNYPHTANISNFDKAVKNEIMAKIKSILGIEA